MTKARNLSDLLDATGDIKSDALDNVPPSNDASALTTGTIDNARISLDANEIPNLDTAKITTGTFDDARMPSTVLNSNVDLTNLSASNLTSGTLPDARFPATLPAISGANLTNLPAGGITEGDTWRFTNSQTTQGDLTTYWERNDSSFFGKLGTGLTVDNTTGRFTFPSTGYYYIDYQVMFGSSGNTSTFAYLILNATTDNYSTSDYAGYVQTHTLSSTNWSQGAGNYIFKVTNTSNNKFNFIFGAQNTTELAGSTSNQITGFSIIKLGDI